MFVQPDRDYSATSQLKHLAEDHNALGDDSMTLLIEKALKDRLLLQEICDRVYQLMLTDLQHQQKRSNYYKGW